MTSEQLPEPIVPRDVDLRGYEFMPLFGDRLLGSETWIGATPEAKLAALRLWWRAYAKEVPASSLPDNDALLADYAGYGVQARAWRKVKSQAMRGFVLCSDQRWYHPFVAELALDAWKGRRAHQLRTLKARIAALEKRLNGATTAEDKAHINGLLRTLRQELSHALEASVTEVSDRPGNTVPKERRGTGTGRGEGKGSNTVAASNTSPTEGEPPVRALPSEPVEKQEVQPATLRGAIAKALRDEGVTGVTPSHPTIVGWVDAGLTVPLAREAVDIARQRKPKPERIPIAYLEPIVEQLRQDPKAMKPVNGKPWFIDTWSKLVEKGAEKGLVESKFDSPPAFRAAVLKAHGITPEQVSKAEADYR